MKKITLLMATLFLSVATSLASAQPAGFSGYQAPNQLPRAGFDHRSGYVSLSIRREMRDNAYILKIYPGTQSTESIQIIPRNRQLSISSRSASASVHQPNRGGYSSTRQWSQVSRRIRLPRDADMNGLVRSNEQGVIIITIPRRPYWPQGPGRQ